MQVKKVRINEVLYKVAGFKMKNRWACGQHIIFTDQIPTYLITVTNKLTLTVLSKIAGGGSMGTVTRGLWSGYWGQMIEDIKSCQPQVKASQSDKQLRSYGHLKIR